MATKDFRSRILISSKSTAEEGFDKSAKAGEKTAKSLGNIAKAGVAAGAAIATVFVADSVRKAARFETGVADLAAITGAAGEDLAFLSMSAREFGRESTLGAAAAAEAFKLVASAKPDLLSNAAALASTTQEVILLSEATGNTLAASANTVGEALNQFGVEADQAARFVNVLAAGSKFGSSEVADTAQALKNAGVAAASAGLSFEETNAAIQVLATVGVKGAEAGTALRSIFIKLQTQANDQFNPAIVGVNAALENLNAANLTAEQSTKLFGQEQFAVASALIENVGKLNELEVALTGTDVASEQAAIRQATFAGKLKLAQSALEDTQITLGDKLLPTLTNFLTSISDITRDLATLDEGTQDAQENFEALDDALRGIVATFTVIKTGFQVVGKAIGAELAIIDRIVRGKFGEIDDVVVTFANDLAETVGGAVDTVAVVAGTKTAETLVETLTAPEVVTASTEAGKKVAVNFFAGIQTISDQQAAEESRAALERLNRRVEAIQNSTATEVEAELARIETIRRTLFEASLVAGADKDALNALAEAAELQHQTNLTEIQNTAITDRASFEKASTKAKAKFVLGELQSLTQGVATQNKALFRINQAAALGNAVVNIAEGITKALSAAPPPFNIALAAITAAAGAAQIAAIASAKPGGGTTPSVAGGVPTLGGQPVGGTRPSTIAPEIGNAQLGSQQNVRIDINGLPTSGMMPAETVRELMSSINDQLGDGVTLDVNGGTTGGNAGTQRGSS